MHLTLRSQDVSGRRAFSLLEAPRPRPDTTLSRHSPLAVPVFHRKFANPAPLGLMAFATTTFVLSFYNTGARGIAIPNVIVGLALGYGGLAQLLAGMWEFAGAFLPTLDRRVMCLVPS